MVKFMKIFFYILASILHVNDIQAYGNDNSILSKEIKEHNPYINQNKRGKKKKKGIVVNVKRIITYKSLVKL